MMRTTVGEEDDDENDCRKVFIKFDCAKKYKEWIALIRTAGCALEARKGRTDMRDLLETAL